MGRDRCMDGRMKGRLVGLVEGLLNKASLGMKETRRDRPLKGPVPSSEGLDLGQKGQWKH
jgi:hypothetical protein